MPRRFHFKGEVQLEGVTFRTYEFNLDFLLAEEVEKIGQIFTAYFKALKEELKSKNLL